MFLLNSCKTSTSEDESEPDAAIVVAALHQNNLGQSGNTSSFLLSQAHSQVHWQPYSKQVFTDAAREKKTIFALIGNGTDSQTIEILEKINASPATCAALNSSHINILIDANQYPDLAFFIASLNINTGNVVSPTQLAWFSHEGIPVSWSSIKNSAHLNIHDIITRMSTTVYNLWEDDPAYVLKNSREDLGRRLIALTHKPMEKEDSLLTIRATRQAGSMFDPTSNSIDNMAGLAAARYTGLMVLAATHPDASEQQRENYTKIATHTADNILLRGLIDPLDGGIFSGIQQSTSALPVFTKTLNYQALSMEALYSLYQLTKDKSYLTAAESIRTYLEKNLTLPDGGYALGIIYAKHGVQDNPCIWSLEEIESTLSNEETKLCIQAFGISGLGNIPLVDDRNRTYFRKNTLVWKKSMEALATQTGMTSADLRSKLSSITKKLAKLRTEKTSHRKESKLSTVESTAALASAYVTAYRATNGTENLKKAKRCVEFIRTQFTDKSGKLQRCRFNGQLLTIPARGIDYASACAAALDLHEATLEPTWLEWAAKLQQEMTDTLANPELTSIREADGSNYPFPYNVRQFVTIKPLNNRSTWALTSANASRLNMRLGGDTLANLAHNLKLRIMPSTAVAPLSNIDYLASDTRLSQKTVYLKAPADPALFKTALPHACQIVPVTEKGNYPSLGDSAKLLTTSNAVVIQRNKTIGTAESSQDLDKLLR